MVLSTIAALISLRTANTLPGRFSALSRVGPILLIEPTREVQAVMAGVEKPTRKSFPRLPVLCR